MKIVNSIYSPSITCVEYYNKTGAKFIGSDLELEGAYSECGHQMPLTDEEGYFHCFLCTVDYKKCDKFCNKHMPKLDEDWKPFIDSVNQRFNNVDKR